MATRRPTSYNYKGSSADPTAKGTKGRYKYKVDTFTYPEDLYGAPDKYGNAWVMININTLTSSKYGPGPSGGVNLDAVDKKLFTEYNDRANNGQGLGQQGTAAGVVAAGAAIAGLKDFLANGTATGALAAGVKGAAIGGFALAPLLLGNVRETKRITTAIQLHMPNDFTTGYNASWGAQDTNLLDMAMRATKGTADIITNLATGKGIEWNSVSGQMGDALLSASLGANSALGAGGISAASGLAANPKKEMIFDGMNFRQFTMTYQFYPKSENEAANIHEILYQLKLHMHPEFKSAGRFTYIYPSEFDITFYTKDGEENLWVNRFATCVLTDLNINYTPQGQWVSKSSNDAMNGYPNMIQASMTFRELSILTKETIEKGF